MALLGCQAVQLNRLGVVLRHAAAVLIHDAEAALRAGVALVGCQPVGGGVTTSWVHTFNLAEAAAGRYLTLQPVSDTYLMVDEIHVYTQ